MQVGTIINGARLAAAGALARSIAHHEPEAGITVLMTEPASNLPNSSRKMPFRLLDPAELCADLGEVGPPFDEMAARYDAKELACALKPWLLLWMLRQDEHALYLDSDTRVYGPLADAWDTHPNAAMLLTPHLRMPLPDDGEQPDHEAIALAGAYNAGFVAVRRDERADTALAWLRTRLRRCSLNEPERGLMLDQRWLDLIPGLIDGVELLRGPAWNAGYWTLATSTLERDHQQLTIDGEALRVFHFTGYDVTRPDLLSVYDTRISLADEPAVREMCDEYAAAIEAENAETPPVAEYAWSRTATGIELTALLRRLWDKAFSTGAVSQTPFTVPGENAFLDWLREGVVAGHTEILPRYLAELVGSRDRPPPDQTGEIHDIRQWAEETSLREPNGILARVLRADKRPRRAGLHELSSDQTLDVERGEIVVCIPVYGQPDLLAECLRSVLSHTPPDVVVLICDDASPDPAVRSLVESMTRVDGVRHEIHYLRQQVNVGFPRNVNSAFACAAPADVIVLNSDCVVGAGWVTALAAAAQSDALVATASAVTNHGTILSLPDRNVPKGDVPQETTVERTAAAVRSASLRLYPRLPTAVGHCMLIRRRALDLVGDFDVAFSPGYGEEVDFSQRCMLHGLVHVAADDCFVLHYGGRSLSPGGTVSPVQEDHERIINARYPYYERMQQAAAHGDFTRLSRALAAGRRALSGTYLTIDGRCLGPITTGTQVHVLELVSAISRLGAFKSRVIVPPDLSAHAKSILEELDGVQLVAHTQVHPGMARSDVAHRPYQVSSHDDLAILSCTGERCLITQQDLIAYRNPGYFPSYAQWDHYQRLTRRALALADAVVFFSHHAARDAFNEDLLEPERARVIYIGVDHSSGLAPTAEVRPEGVEAVGSRPFLLCLGTDFRHKNRVFALRVFERLVTEHGYEGCLMLAGPRVSHGSSCGEEAAFLATRPDLAPRVIQLPAVGEAEKLWLYRHAQAVLYPTTYEGFGLLPFEAAAHGVPCLFASHTALAETLPTHLGTIVPWDPAASARRIANLLGDPARIQAHLNDIQAAAKNFTWDRAAMELADAYNHTAVTPVREARALALDLIRTEAEKRDAERKYNELFESLTEDARALLGPDGHLDAELQRALRAVSQREPMRRVVHGALRAAYRTRHRTHPNGSEPAAEPSPAARSQFELHWGPDNEQHMREHAQTRDSQELIPEP